MKFSRGDASTYADRRMSDDSIHVQLVEPMSIVPTHRVEDPKELYHPPQSPTPVGDLKEAAS